MIGYTDNNSRSFQAQTNANYSLVSPQTIKNMNAAFNFKDLFKVHPQPVIKNNIQPYKTNIN